jgi:hypothetical protein
MFARLNRNWGQGPYAIETKHFACRKPGETSSPTINALRPVFTLSGLAGDSQRVRRLGWRNRAPLVREWLATMVTDSLPARSANKTLITIGKVPIMGVDQGHATYLLIPTKGGRNGPLPPTTAVERSMVRPTS